tara:strand:- start:1497 stop:3272 length:1776 start_codon:yes stop_codon:yes gene_type:complete
MVSDLETIRSQETNTGRGLAADIPEGGIERIIKHLEDCARCGEESARKNMQDLIPICAEGNHEYIDLWLQRGRAVCFDISLFPDLFVTIMRALCYSRSHDGELVCFMRSCLPFMYNSRRTQGDGGWSPEGLNDLVTMLRCCMPTLLSLYPRHGVKDVAFWLRVSIFSFFQKLMCMGHEECNAVYTKLRPLFRVCFVEYVYYFITNVTKIPQKRFMSSSNNETLCANAFNMGQQLRVELNTAYGRACNRLGVGRCILGAEDLVAVLLETTASCQVMYERNTRSSKLIFSGTTDALNDNRVKRRWGTQEKQHSLNYGCEVDLHRIPYTSNFCIFESICNKVGVPSKNIVDLWECTSIVRVFELTTEHTRKQLECLRKNGINCDKQVHECCTLHLCIRCARNNVFSSYRSDLRTGGVSCTKCGKSDMCVKVGMLGRVAFIRNIPIVMCPRCCRFVVYSGNHDDGHCNHVLWGKHVFSPSFQNEFMSNSFMYFALSREDAAASAGPHYATRNFVARRNKGCTQACVEVESQSKTCCMCKSTSLQQTHVVLDCHSKTLVTIRACSRHALTAKFDGIKIYTLQQYLFIANSIQQGLV